MSRLLAVGPALPGTAHSQSEITDTIGPLLTRSPATRAVLARLHAASGVRTRHTALALDEYAGLTSFGAANDHFIRVGTDLAEEACRTALDAAGIDPGEVDFLLFTSVTGIAAPSIDAQLVTRLGLRTDVKRLPSFGLGCVAGAAGIARVHDYLAGHPQDVALLVSVELCSLTLQHGDDSMANLVSTGLFGDGAAAVVMVGDAHPAGRPPTLPDGATRDPGARGTRATRATGAGAMPQGVEVVDTRSRLYPETADHLGWTIRDSGFGIVLSAGLPEVIAAHLAGDVKSLLVEHDLTTEDVGTWVVHAGGPRILDVVRDSLGLDEADLRHSRESLAAVGNLSSSSVLHVLAATLDAQRDDAPGDGAGQHGVLMAFGPGVSAELVLLRRTASPLEG
ncbi:stilbene synthase [Oerskovia sp. Root918]|uniref:type III polyketide synthase n=1 Tax=Oerskovia sp. Root918 TaxID=1736607 RepID=UPI00070168E2|nr:3-oxoacyl-[acyl-carrier-protein] synthase III C-terminal domain-containing protein [Oerskovia sp. Root918]KRD35281.1 stilbene synthase [Oerskovia sp. Root918]